MNRLISGRWLVTPEDRGAIAVIAEGAVAVKDGRIVFCGSRTAAECAIAERWPHETWQRIERSEHILLPGLVNAHTHAAMVLFRGLGDDLPLEAWLNERIWPAEAEFVDAEFVRLGTTLAAAEMLLGGTTCCADMYFYPGEAARAFLNMGMRAQLAAPVLDFPTRYASDADGYLAANLAARDALRNEPLLSWSLGPHAPYTVGDASFRRVLAFASELDLPIHTHLQETRHELAESQREYGCSPTQRLAALGITQAGLIAAHGVHLSEADRTLLARNGASLIHCPSSNLKLASGIADVPAMLAAGLNVGLGTDSAASNNRLDLFEEMRLAALLGKVASGDAAGLSAATALTLATLGGARALRLDEVCGSLEVGKAADLIAVSVAAIHSTPLFDPVSHLIYVASRHDVTDVWVHGEQLVEARQLTEKPARALAECLGPIATIARRLRTRFA
ncbi:MAG: TRZ/ATZ family hydrolase [Casimicrobiaceae bacterium]|nr:TRZ/ATZ family hydrolase [Casimicrobiaceae bacterium]MCX8098370.1 TRZ/ATZ family hydrolase [Casimicrobiaceae bacterium]MDW8312514.1 TRZ/ATZ family hydrolase [Burkholderiales bacterium]